MKLISTNCPNCGSSIDVDPDNISRFCKHCGSKVLLDIDTIQNLLIEREKTKQESIQSEERKRIAELDTLTKLSEERNEHITTIVIFIVMFGVFLFAVIMSFF